MIGGITGAFSGAAAYGVGQAFDYLATVGFKDWCGQAAGRALAHGLTQGALAEMEGGDFRHGFYSAAAGSFGASMTSGINVGDESANYVLQLTMTSAVGGTAAKLGGGKFENGAITAAFVYMFNQALEENANKKKMGVVFIEKGIVDTTDPKDTIAKQAQAMVDDLNGYLKKANIAAEIKLVPYDSLDDLAAQVKNYVSSDTVMAAAIAHGLFTDPDNINTYVGKVGIGGEAIADYKWKNTFRDAVLAINKTTNITYVNCDFISARSNVRWYNLMSAYVTKAISEKALQEIDKKQ